jgi:hypothetical protein
MKLVDGRTDALVPQSLLVYNMEAVERLLICIEFPDPSSVLSR